MKIASYSLCSFLAAGVVFGQDLDATVTTIHKEPQDAILTVPPTFYEGEPTPQNVHYNADEYLFSAIPAWYKNHLVHYYNFRMYTSDSYPNPASVPLQKVYLVTTTGDLSGVIGYPIISDHHVDGETYSDFMELFYVQPEDESRFVADFVRNLADFLPPTATSNYTIIPTGIILNMPLVPKWSKLQHPTSTGQHAPIEAQPVYYRGTELETFIFTSTDQAVADYFQSKTRTTEDPAFAIQVVPSESLNFSVDNAQAVPVLYRMDPYHSSAHNIIDKVPGDDGYSPLTQESWVTQLPVNYEADEASSAEVLLADDSGFETTSRIDVFFGNYPIVGVDVTIIDLDASSTSSPNPKALEPGEFQTDIDPSMGNNSIQGMLVQGVESNVEVKLDNNGTTVVTTITEEMGVYELATTPMEEQLLPKGGFVNVTVIGVTGEEQIRTIFAQNTTYGGSSGADGGVRGGYFQLGLCLVLPLLLSKWVHG